MFVPHNVAAAARLVGDSSSRLADPGVRDPIRHIVLEYLWPRSATNFVFPLICYDSPICFDADGLAMYVNGTRFDFHYFVPNQRSLRFCGAYSCGNVRLLASDGSKVYEACITETDIEHASLRYTHPGKIIVRFTPESIDWESYPISRYEWWRNALYYFKRDDPTNRYPIVAGNNPCSDSDIWYNLTTDGIWSRIGPTGKQYLVGPNEWY